MVSVINAYSVSLGLDASQFINGANTSRSEFNKLKRDIEQARTPVEKFAVEQDRLARALKSGAIDQGTYNRLLESKRPAVTSLTSALGPYAAAIGVVTVGITAASAATVAFISHMRSVQNAIDDQADAAQRLGVSYTDLKSLQMGFKEGGGVEGKTVEDSIKKLQINMAKAVDGDQGLRDSFAKLGLDAGELMGKGPRQAIMAIADGMQGVGTHAERLKISMELFGKAGADLASTLGDGSEKLQESLGFAEKWTSLTDAQVAAVGANNDAWDRIGNIVEGVTSKVAAELAPAFLVVAQTILDGAGGIDGIDSAVKNTVTSATIFVGLLMDAVEPAIEIASRMKAIATFDYENATKPIDASVLSLDKSQGLYNKLEANREKARQDAAAAERKREEQRHAMALEDTEKEKAVKQSALEKLAAEEKRRQDQLARENQRQAQDALKAAESKFQKEIERQQRMQDDVAKGPGAGMEAGSAEAAKFMADQANRAMAESAVKVDAKPTDQQLIEEAKIQSELMRASGQHELQMISGVLSVATAIKDQGWEAV